jgi:hypothetical protein
LNSSKRGIGPQGRRQLNQVSMHCLKQLRIEANPFRGCLLLRYAGRIHSPGMGFGRWRPTRAELSSPLIPVESSQDKRRGLC